MVGSMRVVKVESTFAAAAVESPTISYILVSAFPF